MMATLLLLTMGCAPDPVPQDFVDSAPGDGRLPLRWVPVADESWEEALDGLWWSLAGLGAQPDPGAIHAIEPDDDGVRFLLDPWALGLSDPALEALLAALDPVEAARLDQGMPWTDVGRVLQRTLYEPWVYYAVTGACASVDLPLGRLPADAGEAAITESQLTDGDRRVRFAGGAATVEDIIWVAEGGDGRIVEGNFQTLGTEVVDVMPNGRFRYAVYDEAGGLAPVADPHHTPAGQPGRCMWCHENHLMTGLVQPDVPGFASYEDFHAAVTDQQAMVEEFRTRRGGVVDWQTHAVHTWGEVLVEGFLTPPTRRLAGEWGVDAEVVDDWMSEAGLVAERNEEYPGWGPVWRRADADAVLANRRVESEPAGLLSGTTGEPLPVLPSARELVDPSAAFWMPTRPHACGASWAHASASE